MYRLIPTKPLVPSIDTTTIQEPGVIVRSTSPPFQSTSYVEEKVGKWWLDTGSYPSLRNYDGVSWVGTLRAWVVEVGEYLQVGLGTVDVDLTGIYMDRSKFQAQAAGTDQVWIDITDGKFYAGAGAVMLDADGITIEAGETIDNAVAWVDSSDNVLGKVYTYEEASGNRIMVSGHGIGADYGSAMMQGVDANADDSYIRVASTDGIWLDVTDATVSKVVDVRGGDLRIITAQKKIQFVDSNTEIWEDASGNITFKDAVTGTKTLAELAA